MDITEGITVIPVLAIGGNAPSAMCAETAIASSSDAIITLENCNVSGDVLKVVMAAISISHVACDVSLEAVCATIVHSATDILDVATDDVTMDANSPVAQAQARGTRVKREAAKEE
ncbi:hypothetical protein V6N11_018130 [Hibiscus sabdariffa]|uniref:Uncharacterized protein n=1 Tax=Hibiscus sabdariffa TaxID=183260 RepID=A0ABR2T6U7_9ROSI